MSIDGRDWAGPRAQVVTLLIEWDSPVPPPSAWDWTEVLGTRTTVLDSSEATDAARLDHDTIVGLRRALPAVPPSRPARPAYTHPRAEETS